jgi:hypothetical protein
VFTVSTVLLLLLCTPILPSRLSDMSIATFLFPLLCTKQAQDDASRAERNAAGRLAQLLPRARPSRHRVGRAGNGECGTFALSVHVPVHTYAKAINRFVNGVDFLLTST